jgi:Fur family peroxide stress response transcriptional regulator
MPQSNSINTSSKGIAGAAGKAKSIPDLGDFRMTKQRRVVYDVLTEELDHPTASEVFMRSKERMPGISLATVYNCLETLTQAGIVRQVNVDRDASRFCPNLEPHAHFFCSQCHQVFDIKLKRSANAVSPWRLPRGSKVDDVEVAMKGRCPECGKTGDSAALDS